MHDDVNALQRLRQLQSRKWTHYPAEIIPCWIADMDFLPPEPVHRYLRDSAERGEVGYSMEPLDLDLPELLAKRLAERYHWMLDPQRVEPISDVVQGVYLAILAFTRENDGVILQTPIYPPFIDAIIQCRRRIIHNPLVPTEDSWVIDFKSLEAAIDDRTRMLVLCNPHNPTGRVFRRSELTRLAEIALRYDLIILSDEIFADVIFDGRTHIATQTLDAAIAARTVTFTSASKAFGLGGLRCAFAVFGNADKQARFNALLPPRGRGGFSASTAAVTRIAWSSCQGWQDATRDYLQSNRDHLTEVIRARLPSIRFHPPQATYFAWLDMNALPLTEDAYSFCVHQAAIGPNDGQLFGPPGVGWVRINFATPRSVLGQILHRLCSAVESLG